MPKLLKKRRDRLVCIRVAEGEYPAMSARALAAGYSNISGWLRDLIRRDLRGGGRKGRSNGPVTMAALANRVAALEEAAGL